MEGTPMRFVLNRKKAAQAAAYLVKLHGGRINLMALIKLLYLADRLSLVESGFPITGDRMVSMPHGPVLSQIYDSAKWETEGDPWYCYLSERVGHEVSLVTEEPDIAELSRYETGVLGRIHAEYGHLNQFQLRDLTHELPEWTDPNGSSLPIDPRDILKAEGKSDAEIAKIGQMCEELFHLDKFLNRSVA
jgi:uncharacterized phage-associated protein